MPICKYALKFKVRLTTSDYGTNGVHISSPHARYSRLKLPFYNIFPMGDAVDFGHCS